MKKVVIMIALVIMSVRGIAQGKRSIDNYSIINKYYLSSNMSQLVAFNNKSMYQITKDLQCYFRQGTKIGKYVFTSNYWLNRDFIVTGTSFRSKSSYLKNGYLFGFKINF